MARISAWVSSRLGLGWNLPDWKSVRDIFCVVFFFLDGALAAASSDGNASSSCPSTFPPRVGSGAGSSSSPASALAHAEDTGAPHALILARSLSLSLSLSLGNARLPPPRSGLRTKPLDVPWEKGRGTSSVDGGSKPVGRGRDRKERSATDHASKTRPSRGMDEGGTDPKTANTTVHERSTVLDREGV